MTTSMISAQASPNETRVARVHTAANEPAPHFALPNDASSSEERDSLLTAVDFKWLMAGQGWWIDTNRFRCDSTYAQRFLTSALDSQSFALRDCAELLQAQISGRPSCAA